LHDTWHEIIGGRRAGPGPALARVGLRAASGLYAAGLAANHALYDWHLEPHTQPAPPVVSVGNLTLGGTGKTTTAAFLARRLAAYVPPAIVLRGYGGEAGHGPTIVSDGERVLASLHEAGDEALMLAQMLPGCAVAVGKRRERVIRALATQTPARVVILDDGFQYFRMERRAEIILLDALADVTTWRLFPAGVLREPLRALRRADQVWITHADLGGEERVAALRALVARYCPNCPVVTTRHAPGAIRPLSAGQGAPPSLPGKRVLALSALGNPHAFEQGLAGTGADVLPLRFPDHHAYAPADWDRITGAAEAGRAELVVTTEKDAVKLPPPPADAPPVAVLGCDLTIIEGESQAHDLIGWIAGIARAG
jgi:tetraacyldisaccharide 4'-kinase